MEDEPANHPEEEEQGSSTADDASHPKRHRQLPIRFQASDSEGDDGVLCTICDQKEPPGCSAEIVFWVDCDACEAWAHTYCAFKSNTASRRYKCESCTSSH